MCRHNVYIILYRFKAVNSIIGKVLFFCDLHKNTLQYLAIMLIEARRALCYYNANKAIA